MRVLNRMNRQRPRHWGRRLATTGVAMVIVTAMVADTAAAPSSIDGPASASEAADYTGPLAVDMVSVYNSGALLSNVRDSAIAAAADVGAAYAVGRGFTIGLTRVRRGSTVIQQASGGAAGPWRFPMSVTALPIDTIAGVMGRNVSRYVGGASIVMSQTSASMRGAQVGDTIDVMADGGAIITYTIGRIATDDEVGGAEITMTIQQSDQLGANIDTRVLIWGMKDRAAMEGRLFARGLSTNSKIRVRKSWDAFDPDLTLGVAETKQQLGEFDFTVSSSGAMSVNPAWTSANIPNRTPGAPNMINSYMVNSCHQRIKPDLVAALNDVAAAGLTGLLTGGTIGGCYTPRFARQGLGLYIGSVSRHTWGQAMDINTVANCQGCVPKMDCRIVRIFRAHNFAWGGNFIFTDGMHFEWVGTRRDGFQYPSRYCPNLPGGSSQTNSLDPPTITPATTPAPRSEFFAADGFMLDTGE